MSKGLTQPSSFIPSIGSATTAVDQYRTAAIHSSNLTEINAIFIDSCAIASLGRLLDGKVESHLDIEYIELALQALLLHEIPFVFSLAPKIYTPEYGLYTYSRTDAGLRSSVCFDLINKIGGRDWLLAPELLTIERGQIVSSNLPQTLGPSLKLKAHNDIDEITSYSATYINDSIFAFMQDHNIPYYSVNDNIVPQNGKMFAKQFYHRMRVGWRRNISDITPVTSSVEVPPLLAILLHKSGSRDKILEKILEMRDEIRESRKELFEFNKIPLKSISNADIVDRIRHINASFDAISSEANMTNVQRNRRKIFSFLNIAGSIINASLAFLMGQRNLSATDILNAPGNIDDLVQKSDNIVERTVTAKTFSTLLRVESIQSLLQYHLKPDELRAIERSLWASRNR